MGTEKLRELLLTKTKERGSLTLVGNRESWAKLDWSAAEGFTYFGGDSMTGEEEFRSVVDEDRAFDLLMRKCRDCAQTWGPSELDDAKLCDWIEQNLVLVGLG